MHSSIQLIVVLFLAYGFSDVSGHPETFFERFVAGDSWNLPHGSAPVVTGLEALLRDPPEWIKGKRIGLITNHTGIDRERRRNIDLIAAHPDMELESLFSFEHGLSGEAAPGEKIADAVDQATGLPIHSLYGAVRKPTPEMLQNVDVLMYDVQDVGSRTYTRVSTMALSMEAAGEKGIPFVVLDRPNPITGRHVEGGVLDTAFSSFVGMFPTPLRHGMTVGELARLFVGEFGIEADLRVVPMEGWERPTWFDETGLPWVNTSPNIRRLEAAAMYPGTVLWEGANLSEGRGTDLPFEQTGAPWLDAEEATNILNGLELPGVRFDAVQFRVDDGARLFPGQTLPGIRLVITDRDAFEPVRSALHMIQTIYRLHPEEFEWSRTIDRLAGTDRVREAVEEGKIDDLIAEWDRSAERFKELRAPFLLYE